MRIYGVVVERGKETKLGNVQLKPGFVIDGTVRDAAGAPVGGAIVRIEQSPFTSDDVLRNLAEGNFSTKTSANGYFRIPGVTIVDLSHGRMKIVALTADRFSREEWVDHGNHTIDLILQ